MGRVGGGGKRGAISSGNKKGDKQGREGRLTKGKARPDEAGAAASRLPQAPPTDLAGSKEVGIDDTELVASHQRPAFSFLPPSPPLRLLTYLPVKALSISLSLCLSVSLSLSQTYRHTGHTHTPCLSLSLPPSFPLLYTRTRTRTHTDWAGPKLGIPLRRSRGTRACVRIDSQRSQRIGPPQPHSKLTPRPLHRFAEADSRPRGFAARGHTRGAARPSRTLGSTPLVRSSGWGQRGWGGVGWGGVGWGGGTGVGGGGGACLTADGQNGAQAGPGSAPSHRRYDAEPSRIPSRAVTDTEPSLIPSRHLHRAIPDTE